VPRTTKLIPRRTTRRFFLLNPDRKRIIWDINWYVTALLAEELGIEIHAVQILSNHMHEVARTSPNELLVQPHHGARVGRGKRGAEENRGEDHGYEDSARANKEVSRSANEIPLPCAFGTLGR
jgi:hypothetical protein